MYKREYFKVRNNLIKSAEKGEISYSEFNAQMTELAQEFKPRWGKELSERGKNLGELLMKMKEEN